MAPDMPVQGGGPLQDERRGELLVEGVSKWFRTRQDTLAALMRTVANDLGPVTHDGRMVTARRSDQ